MKRLTINRLAVCNLHARKKQYLFLIIGIVLAITFSSSALFFGFSLGDSLDAQHFSQFGKQEALIFDSAAVNLDSAVDNGLIKDAKTGDILAFANGADGSFGKGTAIAVYDEALRELSNQTLTEGTYPQRAGEIAIEMSVLSRLGFSNAAVGDTITLTLNIPDGTGYLPQTYEKAYKLTGILSDKSQWLSRITLQTTGFERSAYNDVPGAFVSAEEQIPDGGKAVKIAYLSVDVDKDDWLSQLFEFAQPPAKIFITTRNTLYVAGNDIIAQKTALAIVLTLVLLTASCVGIINSFYTNLEERSRQIGMLRAVGATKRQIVMVFGREALLISLISAPISVALSYGAVKLVTVLMGDRFVFVPNLGVLLLCALSGVAIVMLASLLPLIRATKISPIQAIRNIELIANAKNRRVKTQTSFVPARLLAKRNLLLRRGKYTGITLLLVICILLSGIGFTAAKLIAPSVANSTYDYTLTSYNGYSNANWMWLTNINPAPFSENDKQSIYSIPHVESVNGIKELKVCLISEKITKYMCMASQDINLSASYEQYNVAEDWNNAYPIYSELKQHSSEDGELYGIKLVAVEDEVLREIAKTPDAGKVNIEQINSGKEVVMYVPSGVYAEYNLTDNGTGYYQKGTLKGNESEQELSKHSDYAYNDTFFVGDTLNLSYFTYSCEPELESLEIPDNITNADAQPLLGATFSDIAATCFNGIAFDPVGAIVFTTTDGLRAMGLDAGYRSFDIILEGVCDEDIDSLVTQELMVIASGQSGYHLESRFAVAQESKRVYYSVLTGLSAVVILFFAICASMINNSVTATVRKSRRQIGTLRAVGASQRELARSYILQILSIFKWGCAIGFGVYLICAALGAVYSHYYPEQFGRIPFAYWQPLVFTLLLFAVTLGNLLARLRHETKNSIVENIREL